MELPLSKAINYSINKINKLLEEYQLNCLIWHYLHTTMYFIMMKMCKSSRVLTF